MSFILIKENFFIIYASETIPDYQRHINEIGAKVEKEKEVTFNQMFKKSAL